MDGQKPKHKIFPQHDPFCLLIRKIIEFLFQFDLEMSKYSGTTTNAHQTLGCHF